MPLTLAEALIKDAVRVHETGSVNELAIENLGNEEIFVQSGDIMKGGQQDRVLTVSLILPPRSGRVPIASFCVEKGRWAARGNENVRLFSSAETTLPSRKAKIAIRAPSATGRACRNLHPPGSCVGRCGTRPARAGQEPQGAGGGGAIAKQPSTRAGE